MLSPADMRQIAQERLVDAEILITHGRFDSAFYLCGYAVEIALKAQICTTLAWHGFPSTAKEFEGLQSLKTHDLEVLLRLSGVEAVVNPKLKVEWSTVLDWNPEKRYGMIGLISAQVARAMADSAKALVAVLK